MVEKEIKPINILTRISKPVIKKHMEGVYTATIPIGGIVWFETGQGTVLIDTLLNIPTAEQVLNSIHEKIRYIIYTHGHSDHVGGAKVFMEDNPEVIASINLPDRFDRYKILKPYRNLIAAMQFNIPKELFGQGLENYIYPTKTFFGDYTFELGKYTFELHTARGETDDAIWVYIPELNTAVVGDLIMGPWFPNIGNPWKSTRFALDWVKALERIQALDPNYIFCRGGGYLFKGKNAKKALNDNIEVIRSLHDQVVNLINEGVHITEMIHAVKIPEHLKDSPFLRQDYSRPEFFVYNVYRRYHGYYDHNPAHLIPRPEKEVMKEIYGLIGDKEKIIARVKDLFNQEQHQLALEILDVLLQSEPKSVETLSLRMKLVKSLAMKDTCIMSKNAYFYSIKKDKQAIRRIQNSLNKKPK